MEEVDFLQSFETSKPVVLNRTQIEVSIIKGSVFLGTRGPVSLARARAALPACTPDAGRHQDLLEGASAR